MKIFHEFRQFDVDGVNVQITLDVHDSPIGEYSIVKTTIAGLGSHTMEIPTRVANITHFMNAFTSWREKCAFGEEKVEVAK